MFWGEGMQEAVRAAIASRAVYADAEGLRGLVPVEPSVSGGRCGCCFELHILIRIVLFANIKRRWPSWSKASV